MIRLVINVYSVNEHDRSDKKLDIDILGTSISEGFVKASFDAVTALVTPINTFNMLEVPNE